MTEFIEKRSAPRHKVFKGGMIACNGYGFQCTVRNMSSGGAALDVEGSASLPPSFMLAIAADHFLRRCRPVWSQDQRFGVAFD